MTQYTKQEGPVYTTVIIHHPDEGAKAVLMRYSGYFAGYEEGRDITTVKFYMESENDKTVIEQFLNDLRIVGWTE